MAVTSRRQRPSAGAGSRRRRVGREGDRVRPRLLQQRLGERSGAAGRDERRGHVRGADDLVGQLALPLGVAVAVRRDHRVRGGRVDAVVHELERVRDRPLAAAVGRAVEQLPVERERGGAAAVEGRAGDGAEPDHRLRELEVRHPDAVAGSAAVGDDHQHAAVGELADAGARVPRSELARGERLLRAEDGTAVANEHRAAADGVRDPGPFGPEDQPQRQLRPERRLLEQPLRRRAARDENGAVPRDRRAAAGGDVDDGAGQVGVRRRRRERRDHDLCDPRLGGRGLPVGGREERDAVRSGRLVEVVQRPALAEAAPGAEELDPADVETAFGGDAGAGAVAVGRALDDVVAHQHAARPPGVGVEVAVDADHRRARREPLLHRGDALDALDRLVRERRAEGVQAGGTRAADDVDRDRAVRGELDAALVGDAGHQRRRRRRGRRGEDQGEKPSDEQLADHDRDGG